MPIIKQVRRTYKYRMYRNDKRDKYLSQSIEIAAQMWNYCIALQRRYHRLFGGYVSQDKMQERLKKRRNSRRYASWKQLGSQAMQEVAERVHKAYQKFFDKKGGRPQFKKVTKYKSFTLKKTAGWVIHPDKKEVRPRTTGNAKGYQRGIGVVTILGRKYQFIKHRPLNGDIKTVTIKRDRMGQLWICFSVIEDMAIAKEVSTGEIGGFDFGLLCFLKDHRNKDYPNPEFYKEGLPRIRSLSRSLSRKQKGSRNRRKTHRLLAREHIRIEDKRRDFHYKLAHQLCDRFDVLTFEDLHIAVMKQWWGRKVSDLAFSQFLDIVKWVAFKRGKTVIIIDRFEPTTQTCSACGAKQKLALSNRSFDCPNCDLVLDRDHNAAINIQRIGASMHTARGD